jgi:peroxiredoxin Q/BCP
MLQVNDLAPIDIPLTNLEGNKTTLKEFLNKKYLVVYFYPKDDTPGCTTEACELRDYNQDIEKLGARIIGISKDSPKSHNKFKSKYNLNFELLSDESHNLQEAFGIWQQKKFMGKTYMGTVRSTFILDNTGKIIKVWEEVKPQGHAKEVYEFLSTIY